MMVPGLILDIFATIMLVVAGVSTARLITARAWRGGGPEADIDVAHALMGIAMAGMLTARLATLPNGVWASVFGALTAWFGYQVTRDSRGRGARAVPGSHHTPHLVHSAAMLYMFLALAPAAGSGAAGMVGVGGSSGQATRTLSLPIVALIFAFLLAGYAVRDLDRISGPAAHGQYKFAGPALAPAGGALAGASALAESPAAAYAGPLAPESGLATVAQPQLAETAPATSGGGSASGTGPDMARRLVLAPGLVTDCRIAMGVTMAFMLAIMI